MANASTRDAAGRLLVILLALGSAGSAAHTEGPQPMVVYVGTYTDAESRGIYRFSFDPATGAASEPALAAETRNPSFLALHPNGRFLYAVAELPGAGRVGAVSAFAIDPKTGDLALLNQQPSEGAGPCHLVVDASGRNVLVANYGGGTVGVLPIRKDGRLAAASHVARHEGSGPNQARQDKPHAHGIYLDAEQRFAFSPDLGADRIFTYRFLAEKGALAPHAAAPLDPGAGPRHLAFHPQGRFLYAVNELLSTVTGFAYEPASGSLSKLETLSLLPEGHAGTTSAAEVAVSADGRYLYASNRGHDSLAVFRIDRDTGRLTPSGHVPVGGKTPRHFTLDPSGRWLLAAHQGSGTIAVFKIDPATGMPTPTGTTVRVDKPVCLLPVPRR